LAWDTPDHQFDNGVIVRDFLEVLDVKGRLELLDQELSISCTNAERNDGTDVTDDRVSNLFG